ncbi:MAG: hypothetical protein A2V66_14160 [Ignavibacteria bacterium RBG_13_36_8]|nr:MAG: hypothetical protein A2V66_14160 [Ignavibacteria bacterium RBG_13_36_8]
MTWTENDSVNVKIIDHQHREIISIINELHSLLNSNDAQKIYSLTNKLYESLKIHFQTEEYFMTEHNYPGYISHKLEHDRYKTKISDFKESLEKGKIVLNLEIFNSLKKWFYNHLELNDKKLGRFLTSQNLI